MDSDLITVLYNQTETVFSIDEISQLKPNISAKNLKNRLYRAVVSGKLKRLHRGLYAKETYNPFELATKIYTPSYISLETVLVQHGIVFQHYTTMFVVSYLTREVTADGQVIQLRKMYDTVLTNTTGLERKPGYFIATPERALLDAMYIYRNYHFDNLGGIDWDKVEEYKQIYGNDALNKRVNVYYKEYEKEYGKH